MIHVSEKAARAGELLLDTEAVGRNLESPFLLAGVLPSPIYVDVRKTVFSSSARRELTRLLAESVREHPFDAVAGTERADVPYGSLVADLVDLPFVYVRKGRLDGDLRGRKVLLVEDDASTLPLDVLRGAGAICEHVAVVFHHEIFPLKAEGITLHALTNFKLLIDEAERGARFSPSEIQGIRAFLSRRV